MTSRRTSRGGRTRSRRGARPRYNWTSMTLYEQSDAPGAQTIVDALGSFTVAEKRDVRSLIRLVFKYTFHQISANSEIQGRFGFHVITDDALAAGVVPEPLGDSESSWWANESYFADRPEVGFRDVVERDIRTGRRLPGELSTLAFIHDNNVASGGSVGWSIAARILYTRA